MSDSIIDRVSEERFLEVYNKHLPNKWTKLAFRYFSMNTVKKDKWLSRVFFAIGISLFLIAFALTVFGASHVLVEIPTIMFCVLLITMGIFRFGAFIMNNLRIRRITHELEISRQDYEFLVSLYLES